MKKVLAIVLALVLVMMVGFGCSAPEAKPEAAPSSEAVEEKPVEEGSEEAAVSEMSLWHYYTDANEKFIKDFCAKYEADTGVKVVPVYLGDELNTRLQLGLASGDLGDIIQADHCDYYSFTVMGCFAPIDDYIAGEEAGFMDSFLSGMLPFAQYEGKTYGLPLTFDALCLFYNIDLLTAAGIETPPKTWDELLTACAAVTTDDTYGIGISATNNEEGTFQVLPWVWSAGGDYSAMGSEGGIRSLSFVKELLDKGYMPADVVNWTQMDAAAKFMVGDLAMMINAAFVLPSMCENAPDLNYGVSLMPTDTGESVSILGGELIGVGNNASNPEAAYDFVSAITTTGEGRWEEDTNSPMGGNLTLKMVPNTDVLAQGAFAENEILKAFSEQAINAKARGPQTQWPSISTFICGAEQDVLTGAKTPEEAAAYAQEQIEPLLD